MRLADAASVLRSKNAGIHHVTIDVMFEDPERFEQLRRTDAFSAEVVADRLDIPESDVKFFEYEPGLAFKITFPRDVPVGSPSDSDVFGAQQYAPILDLEVPIE